MILGGLVFVNILLVLAYRKYLQKEIKEDMKIQVSSAVSQYVALSQISELNNPPQKTSASTDESLFQQ